MAEVIKMPRLSDTMEEGVVAQWLKKVGDKVSEGDILAEIETDKATMEFESFYDGTLLHIAIDEGVAANVDSLLCIIGEEGEDISSLISNDSNVIEETSNSQLDLVDQINKQEQINEEVISNKETEESALSDSENDIQNETLAISDDVDVEFIKMPRLSDTMEEGTISSWLKNVGDDISEGDILAEIETDKATMEFESFYSGKLVHIGVSEGETVKVDDLIAIISDGDVDVKQLLGDYENNDNSLRNLAGIAGLNFNEPFWDESIHSKAQNATYKKCMTNKWLPKEEVLEKSDREFFKPFPYSNLGILNLGDPKISNLLQV